jgi:hypothetical protein
MREKHYKNTEIQSATVRKKPIKAKLLSYAISSRSSPNVFSPEYL